MITYLLLKAYQILIVQSFSGKKLKLSILSILCLSYGSMGQKKKKKKSKYFKLNGKK